MSRRFWGSRLKEGVSRRIHCPGQIVSRFETSLAAHNWGLFDKSGEAVLTAAHVWQLDFQRSFDISTAPVENGQFAAYNKSRYRGSASFPSSVTARKRAGS